MKKIVTLITVLFCWLWSDAIAKVSIVTFFPGNEIYELDGHTALRIVDDNGHDMMYNWGTFDFNTPNFVYRFVKGETDYRLEGIPSHLFLGYYEAQGRRAVEQTLNLTDRQIETLIRLVDNNMKPENRVYRYNYLFDNCATRPLAIIERALGDTITLGTAPHSADDTSFRAIMTRAHANYPWYQFGIDLALGNGIDRPVTNRERSFAPVDLMRMLSEATITASGHPIIGHSEVILPGHPGGGAGSPTPWWATPLTIAWILCALSTLITLRDLSRRAISRWFDTFLYSIFGLAGLLLTFLIFISVHEATSPNWLYLWLNPLCFIGATGIYIKSAARAVYWWQILNFALLVTLCILAIAGVQNLNAAFWPLILADLTRSTNYIYHRYKCNSLKKYR